MKKLFDLYDISEDGRVYNTNFKGCGRRREVKPRENHKGYLRISLMDGGKQKSFQLHRLVALCYLGNPEGYIVDHVDKNIKNNHYSNLRLLTTEQSNQNRSFGKDRCITKHRRRWVVTIKYNYKSHRKSFCNKEDSIQYRDEILPVLQPYTTVT